MTPEQNETLRHAVLEMVALRHPTAQPGRAIRRVVAREVDFALDDEAVRAAAEFHVGLGNFSSEIDPLGSTKYYQATPAGVLAYERRGK